MTILERTERGEGVLFGMLRLNKESVVQVITGVEELSNGEVKKVRTFLLLGYTTIEHHDKSMI